MNEYIVLSTKKRGYHSFYEQWLYQHLLQKRYLTNYDDALFQQWCYPFEKIDEILYQEYHQRYDYKWDENLHTLFNELTKEIVIIITNRYQIIVKCDKIPIGVVKTVRNYYPNIKLFCRNKDFEEVET